MVRDRAQTDASARRSTDSSHASLPKFRAQAVEEALRKDRDCPAEKETPKKGKGRGQASEKIRSPLHLTWKRVQARGAKVHACGAQINQEFRESSEKAERVRGNSEKENSLAAAPAARFGNLRASAERGKKGRNCKAAASVRDGWKKETKIMKTCGTEASRSRKIQKSVSKSRGTDIWRGRYCR